MYMYKKVTCTSLKVSGRVKDKLQTILASSPGPPPPLGMIEAKIAIIS
jgi:hypothetical protein